MLSFWADVSSMSESAGGRSFTAPRQNFTSPPDTADDAARCYIQRIASGYGRKIDDGEGARLWRLYEAASKANPKTQAWMALLVAWVSPRRGRRSCATS